MNSIVIREHNWDIFYLSLLCVSSQRGTQRKLRTSLLGDGHFLLVHIHRGCLPRVSDTASVAILEKEA